MKSLIYAGIAAVVLAVPAVSFAQQTDNAPVTRAQVRAQLKALTNAGYDPNDAYNYPENIQAAEQRVRAEQAQAANAGTPAQVAATQVANTSSGASTNGVSQSGWRIAAAGQDNPQPVYFGH